MLAALVTGAASGIGRATAERPGGSAFSGVPVTMDLGWSAR